MQDSITCPNCKKPIPLTEAITHQIDEKYEKELESVKQKAEEERQRLIELSKKRIEEEKQKSREEATKELKKKIQDEMELQIKNTQEESKELKEQKKQLQEQLLEMNKLMRKLQDENREKELEMQKKFNEEQDKLRKEEQRRIEEQYKLKMLEQDKKLSDVLKANEELRRKLEQGSQQMQGEVLELAIEELLQKEFPFDEIKEVPKGVNGADIIQIVRNRGGKVCGTIIWETKRTKNWSHQWIPKLKTDQRTVKAEIAVLVSEIIPDGIDHFGLSDGVWVCGYEYILGVAGALRSQLLEIASVRAAQKGQEGKMEVLYEYVTSTEFKHRVEAILESFNAMQEEIEKERRWFALKWAREEKNLRKVFDSTLGMQGDLQSIVGKSLPELESVEMLPGEDKPVNALKNEKENTLFDTEEV